MTDDELNHVEAGRELDFLIATRVFGLEPWPNQRDAPFMLTPNLKAGQRHYRGVKDVLPVDPPRYSQNEQSAALVRAALCQRGQLSLTWTGTDWHALVNSLSFAPVSAAHKDLPVALCRCLLKYQERWDAYQRP